MQIWKIPAREGATERDAVPIQNSHGAILAGMDAIESPGGATLYCVPQESGHELWAIPVAGGEAHPVIRAGIIRGWWTPARGGIYYVEKPAASGLNQRARVRISLFHDEARGTSHVIGELPGQPPDAQPGIAVGGNALWTDWVEVSSVNLVRADLRTP